MIHGRDAKLSTELGATIEAAGVETVEIPTRSPDLHVIAERWARSVRGDCTSRIILFRAGSLRRKLEEHQVRYQAERNHQGKGDVLLFPQEPT